MRRSLIVAATLTTVTAVVAAVGAYAVLYDEKADVDAFQIPTASDDDLAAVADGRVFFAHQSVGGNILDGVPAVYRAHGLPAPDFTELTEAGAGDNLRQLRVGENGDPAGKLEEFDSLIRGGLGDQLDVAVLKLCYSDIREDTDVEATFAGYRDTFTALQEDYPEVVFVPATVPLNIIRGPLGKVKAVLGQGDRFGPEHNVAREEFNALVRAEYAGSGVLFDVASIESTAPDGERVATYHDGELFYALARDYASDPGHLNPTGSQVTAEAFVATVARALER